MTNENAGEARVHQVLNDRRNRASRGAGDGANPLPAASGFIAGFLRMMRDPAHRFPPAFKVYAVLGILYILSPIDLVPEVIFGPLGIVDDLGVAMLLLRMVQNEVAQYLGKDDGKR